MSIRPSPERDARLLRLDYLAEVGDALVAAGAALAAGASAENLAVLELALRHARAAVVDAIGEFRALPGNPPVSEALRVSTTFREAVREYHEGRIAR